MVLNSQMINISLKNHVHISLFCSIQLNAILHQEKHFKLAFFINESINLPITECTQKRVESCFLKKKQNVKVYVKSYSDMFKQ